MARQNRNQKSGGGDPKGAAGRKRPTATLDLKAEDLTPEPKALAGTSDDEAQSDMEKPEQEQRASASSGGNQANGEGQSTANGQARKVRGRMQSVSAIVTHVAAGLAGGIIVLAIATQYSWIRPVGDVGEINNVEIANRLADFERKLSASNPEKHWRELLGGVQGRLEKAETELSDLAKKTAGLAKSQENSEARFKKLLASSSAGGSDNLAAAALNNRIGDVETRLDEKFAALKQDLGESAKRTADDLSKRVAKKAAQDEVEALRRLLRDGTERYLRDLQAVSSETRELRRTVSGLERQLAMLQSQSEKVREVSQSLQPVNRQIAALEKSISGLIQRESKLQEGSRRTALAIALTSLRRAVDTGSPFAKELDAFRTLAPKDVPLQDLERLKDTGVPTIAALERSFPAMIKAVLDADVAQKQDSVIGQLLSNARSVVRIRRTGEIAGDSTEAVIARMETRVKSGNLTAAVEEAGALKGEALREAEPWLNQVRARIAVDWAMRRVETELVAFLGAGLGQDESKNK